MVCGRIRQHLHVVGRVLVVSGHVDGHQTGEELLGGLVEGEERVPVDVVELALAGRWSAGDGSLQRGGVQAQQLVQPELNLKLA